MAQNSDVCAPSSGDFMNIFTMLSKGQGMRLQMSEAMVPGWSEYVVTRLPSSRRANSWVNTTLASR